MINQARRARPANLTVEAAALAVAGIFTLALLVFIDQHCYFYGDDFTGFVTAETFPFGKALLVPIGSQAAPLHRLINMGHFFAARMNFRVAVGVLLAFHLLGAAYLYRTLELFERTWLNAILVAWYCAHAYLIFALEWWSNGLQRIPYVAFAIMSIYYYSRYSRERRGSQLAGWVLCYLVALGFYAKTLLLPLCFVALDLIRRPNGPLSVAIDRSMRARWLGCAVLVLVGILYLPISRHLAGGGLRESFGNLDPSFQLRFQWIAFTVLAHSAFGIVLGLLTYKPRLVVGVIWALFILYTSFRARRGALVWLCLAIILLLNFAMFAVSARTGAFGLTVACELRYFYELSFLVALFVGLVLHGLRREAPELRWLIRSTAVPWIAAAALAAYAVFSYRNSTRIQFLQVVEILKTKAYVSRLLPELSKAKHPGEPLKLADGSLPVFMTGFDFSFRRQSQFLHLLGIRADFVPREQADWEIDETGRLVSLRP